MSYRGLLQGLGCPSESKSLDPKAGQKKDSFRISIFRSIHGGMPTAFPQKLRCHARKSACTRNSRNLNRQPKCATGASCFSGGALMASFANPGASDVVHASNESFTARARDETLSTLDASAWSNANWTKSSGQLQQRGFDFGILATHAPKQKLACYIIPSIYIAYYHSCR
jgi:hypothetical protein